MSTVIKSVDRGSPAAYAGIRAGETLLTVDNHPIHDVLDYKFYTYDPRLQIRLRDENGRERLLQVEKAEGEELGLEFDSYLMDEQKGCSNHCIFCFIDQLPRGMRKTLYFKDDDARLSFLMGNYITMTNLTDQDVDRIIAMRLSPLNISVHTTDPELRSKMLGNVHGGDSLRHLWRLAEAGIAIKAQIVVCPGLNDGAELQRTMRKLSDLSPALESLAIVPVGITKHRQGLYPLTPMDAACARDCIALIDAQRTENEKKYGQPLCFAADELYIKAGLPMPQPEYYCGYSQLENGVGLMALFEEELRGALMMEDALPAPEPFTIACGKAAESFMRAMIDLIRQKCHNLQCEVVGIRNDFFGDTVDVSGLITGGDIIAQLQGKMVGKRLLLPAVMLRHGETVFLDDVSIADVEAALDVRVHITEVDGGAFLDTIFETGGQC